MFDMTPDGFTHAMAWAKREGHDLEAMIKSEPSANGYTMIALANSLWRETYGTG